MLSKTKGGFELMDASQDNFLDNKKNCVTTPPKPKPPPAPTPYTAYD